MRYLMLSACPRDGNTWRLAAKFHADVASKKLRAPTYGVLIPYNLFRGMSLSCAPGTPYATEDGVHWTDACRARRAYDPSVPLSLPKRAFGWLFDRLGRLAGRPVTVTCR